MSSCSNGYHKYVSNYTFRSADGKPDYSNLDHWAAHPYKKDPSDSVPQYLRAQYKPDTTVDVFFIHPTTYTEKDMKLGWNAPIDDADLNAKTDYSTILLQASIFNEAGRLFAPRYRQANLYSYYPKTAADSSNAIAAFELAYSDIKTAFQYYLDHLQQGRPIVIASHSQGTTHAKRLIKEFFEGKPLQQKLVVAYLVGIQVEPDYFSNIKPCYTPNQTGCFCSWRTFKEGYVEEFVTREKFIAVVTNPLTWDTTKPLADREMNKGGILLNFNKPIEKVVNAKVHEGVLWTEKPHFFGNFLYTSKNYHIADLNFFYLSIRENVKERIAAYTKK
jgi:hypothetical protein